MEGGAEASRKGDGKMAAPCPGAATSVSEVLPDTSGFLLWLIPLGPQGREGVGRWDPRPVPQRCTVRPLTPGGGAPTYQELEVSGQVRVGGAGGKTGREQDLIFAHLLCLLSGVPATRVCP